ncbi:MAG TPA: response regulator [Hyphomicrobiaceae bacterium]|nr:response regulator [Hyphomicrobiaceae bacterium]
MRGLDHIRHEIPCLRRCGRALTGEQRLADICVIQLMDEMLSGSDFIATASLPRVGLYRRFFDVLRAAALTEGARSFEELFSPLPYQAHWLRTVEDFSEEGAAEALDVSLPELRTALRDYQTALAGQKAASIMIIEDEALIAHDLKRIVTSMGHKVTGVARTRNAAVARFERDNPDLVLSDVQLADGSSGIDAVDTIQGSHDVPVIFITAFPERLLTGTRGEPAFLISKPFEPGAVAATVSQALFLASRVRPTMPMVKELAAESLAAGA